MLEKISGRNPNADIMPYTWCITNYKNNKYHKMNSVEGGWRKGGGI